jgi:hypothetical protein
MKRYVLFLVLIAFICGCGGGGGSSTVDNTGTSGNTGNSGGTGGDTGGTGGDTGANDPSVPTPTQYAQAVVTLSTQGLLPQESSIAGIGINLALPPGVTVPTVNGAVASGVVTGSGEAVSKATITSDLVPSTSTSTGALRLVVASTQSAGFRVGEFATVICNIAEGSFPQVQGFPVSGFRAVDLHGVTITSLAPASRVEFR